MILFRTVEEVRAAVTTARQLGQSVGLVAAAGGRQDGLHNLIGKARQKYDRVMIGVLIDPNRLDQQEITLCQEAGADWIFAPEIDHVEHLVLIRQMLCDLNLCD